MASFASVRHHGWRTQAAWTKNILKAKLLEKKNSKISSKKIKW